MMLFIKLLLAHLIGDFVLQPDSWVREKEIRGPRSPKLYLHGFIHLILILLFTWNVALLPAAILIAVTHVAIDAAKLYYQNKKNKRFLFFADQLLHIVVLVFATLIIERPEWNLHPEIFNAFFIILTGLIFLLTPSSVIIRMILSKWAPATEIKTDKIETPSLMHAGMMIGYLERVLVFIFILANQWAAIGFLVTAKSVFRFSDLKIGQDRKLTEYILIGTLLSFGMAIITGSITSMLLTFPF